MANFLTDILEACKGIEKIRYHGSDEETVVYNGREVINQKPCFDINGRKVKSIVRKVMTGDGDLLLDPLEHFFISDSCRIIETKGYIMIDEENNVYELRKNNGHELTELTGGLKKDYLKRILGY